MALSIPRLVTAVNKNKCVFSNSARPQPEHYETFKKYLVRIVGVGIMGTWT